MPAKPAVDALPLAQIAPAALAGVGAFAGASLLPFYPAHWPLALGAGAAALSLVAPRAAMAIALATPLLPLGNLAFGLAVLWAVAALAWLAVAWGQPRAGLAILAGPLLAPLGLVGLVPLAVQAVRGHVRRGLTAAAAILLAVVAAAARGVPLPFAGGPPPGLGLAGEESAPAAATALLGAVPAALLAELAVLSAVAVAIPFARGPWRIAALGAGTLAGTILVAPATAALPLVAAAWLTCAVLAARDRH